MFLLKVLKRHFEWHSYLLFFMIVLISFSLLILWLCLLLVYLVTLVIYLDWGSSAGIYHFCLMNFNRFRKNSLPFVFGQQKILSPESTENVLRREIILAQFVLFLLSIAQVFPFFETIHSPSWLLNSLFKADVEKKYIIGQLLVYIYIWVGPD